MTRGAEAEARRILDRYRRLILLGKARLPLEQARRLVGPDCVYHLYFRHGQSAPASTRRRHLPRKVARDVAQPAMPESPVAHTLE
jgi:hypothetical protein